MNKENKRAIVAITKTIWDSQEHLNILLDQLKFIEAGKPVKISKWRVIEVTEFMTFAVKIIEEDFEGARSDSKHRIETQKILNLVKKLNVVTEATIANRLEGITSQKRETILETLLTAGKIAKVKTNRGKEAYRLNDDS